MADPNKPINGGKLSPLEWEEARSLWETNHDVSFSQVGIKYGVSKQVVAKKANTQGWERALNKADIVARAQEMADRRLADEVGISREIDDNRRAVVVERVKKLEKLPPKMAEAVVKATTVDAKTTDNLPVVPPEAPGPLSIAEALPATSPTPMRSDGALSTPEERANLRRDTSVEIVASVIDRHRREWSAARALSIEAVRERNFDKAKLAKITAETIGIIQHGERKAYGIEDAGSAPQKPTVVVVERGGVRRTLPGKD